MAGASETSFKLLLFLFLTLVILKVLTKKNPLKSYCVPENRQRLFATTLCKTTDLRVQYDIKPATASDPPVVKTTTGLATSNKTTPATTTLITTTTTVTSEISGFGEVTCYVDFIGDQYCDDLNNKEECSFDGGDCCPAENVTLHVPWQTYCTECCCKDESGTILTCDNGTCQDFQLYVGDGYCDDITNHEDCDFDGGDCCGNDIDNSFCDECCCISEDGTSLDCLDEESKCMMSSWIGDGFCDDDTNNEKCEYDGGDCCDGHKSTCIDCYCFDDEKEDQD